MRSIRVMEPFHSLFYAPLHVSLGLGHFRAEGLDVTTATPSQSGGTVGALLDGSSEICLGGIMRSLHLADRDGGLLPHFIEVNSRNGFFLLGREPRPAFRWADLAGKTVLSFAEAPTPWQCMLTILRREGVDPATVRIERDRPLAEKVAAWRAGHGDFLETGQPIVEQLVAEGAAHLIASMGDATGPVPFSSYMTTPARLRDDRELLLAFTRAVYRTQQWMAGTPAAEIAGVIAPRFSDIPERFRVAAVERYARQGTWARDPLCRREGYEYLQQVLLDGGFIKTRHRYEDLIDTSIARQVMEGL
ncbi:MAG: ABC transporter substrate-binding protein [Candidatus Rokubacteria bacterium]|nr:ABC transporter substrate-binding protein [Candidatus Rokubacteria bacterium]